MFSVDSCAQLFSILLLQSEEDTIASLIELVNILNTDMQKAQQYYNVIYEG